MNLSSLPYYVKSMPFEVEGGARKRSAFTFFSGK